MMYEVDGECDLNLEEVGYYDAYYTSWEYFCAEDWLNHPEEDSTFDLFYLERILEEAIKWGVEPRNKNDLTDWLESEMSVWDQYGKYERYSLHWDNEQEKIFINKHLNRLLGK
jgi:hypothetical protein